MDVPTSVGRSTLVACLLVGVLAGVVVAGAVGAETLGSADDSAVVVADFESGDRLLTVPVSDGDAVSIEYTHSVHKSEVIEAYVVDGDDRVLAADRMVFSTYGAGMPSHADVERTDDGRFVYETNGTHEQLNVKPGSIAGHELVVDGERHDLVALSNEDAVVVRVERRSTLATLADRLLETGLQR